jgi:transcription antitermination factor NusG
VPVEVGDKVKVFDGPLAGLMGIFKECKGENRALLLMNMLGAESTVEVDSLLLQKVV